MSYITTRDDTKIFYKDWGSGKPILFVHAWAMSSSFWEYAMLHLNNSGFRCIAFDRRGHGKSDDPGKGYNFDTLTDDLNDLIENLGLTNVVIVGHSMGGCEVINYQSKYGHLKRLSKLVLIATPDCLLQSIDNPEGIPIAGLEYVLSLYAIDFAKWIRENSEPFYLPTEFNISSDIIQWTINMMLQTSMKAVIDCQREVFYSDKRNLLPNINIPTLIIHGDNDASIPYKCAVQLSEAIPNSILKTYVGAPHGLIISHANQLYNDLIDFCNDNRNTK